MTADETGDDKLLQQRVRDAILQAGGVPTVSARTGIPKKTLEKYLAKRSMASLSNAAKIAEAAGLSLTEMVNQSGTATAPRGTVDVAAYSDLSSDNEAANIRAELAEVFADLVKADQEVQRVALKILRRTVYGPARSRAITMNGSS
ncbi:MAG: helix-turn-helix transcriptional regulator [Mesorhizobium sp.]|nr:MAG: helix-turn-helix transcriptional regulator [Mesorhizobium sp.]